MKTFFVLLIPKVNAKSDTMDPTPESPVPVRAMPESDQYKKEQSVEIDIKTLPPPAIVEKIIPEDGCGRHIPVGPEL